MKGTNSSIEVVMTIDNAAWNDALPSLQSLVNRAAPAVWHWAGRDCHAEASVVMSSDSRMRELNYKHRDIDCSTNVLAFPLGETMWPDGTDYLGDVVLAYETVVREAARDAKRLDAHVTHLLVHGLLHLLGHDHETKSDAERMEEIEVEIITSLGYPNPYRELTHGVE